jgi:hypothetical protein
MDRDLEAGRRLVSLEAERALLLTCKEHKRRIDQETTHAIL